MVVGRRYFQDSSVGGGATPRLARGGRAGGMDDFKAWLRSSDFWWDESAIELGASFPSTDGAGPPAPRAGVRALRRLEAGDVLARIPRARCLTRASCAYPDAASRARASSGGDEERWLACLGAALLLERRAASRGASSFAPYLASLPGAEPDVVASWPDRHRRLLAGTDVDVALRDERAQARAEWDGGVAEALAEAERRDDAETTNETTTSRPALGDGAVAGGGVSFEDFLAARSVASSRAFTVDPTVGAGLVPIADLFNHRTGGHHVRLTDDPEDPCGGFLVVRCVAPVDPGEEVFNSYGVLGNAKLLRSYGFAQPNNPADVVTFDVPAVRAAAAMRGVAGERVAARLGRIRRHLGPGDAAFGDAATFEIKADGAPPEALLLALWALAEDDEARFEDVLARASTRGGGGEGGGGGGFEDGGGVRPTAEAAVRLAEVARPRLADAATKARAMDVLEELIRRRRAMYYRAPPTEEGTGGNGRDGEGFRREASSDSGSDARRRGLAAALAASEFRILSAAERFAAGERSALEEGSFGGERPEDDGGKRRKTAAAASRADDAFSLFD